jgi:hypothetical protein
MVLCEGEGEEEEREERENERQPSRSFKLLVLYRGGNLRESEEWHGGTKCWLLRVRTHLMSGSITRAEFEKKCIEFVEAHRQPVDNAYLISMLDGWEWVSHSLTGYGHLHRQRTFASHPLKPAGDMEEDATINEEEDTAAIHTHQSAELITVHEYVVFSATYQLPAYCFNVFKSGKRCSTSSL